MYHLFIIVELASTGFLFALAPLAFHRLVKLEIAVDHALFVVTIVLFPFLSGASGLPVFTECWMFIVKNAVIYYRQEKNDPAFVFCWSF